MADEDSQSVPATSGRSEVVPLTEVSPAVVTEADAAAEVNMKREKTWGGSELHRAQVEGVEDEDEDNSQSVAVTQGAAPKKKKKKKSKSKGQRGLVDPMAIPTFLNLSYLRVFQGKPTGFEEYYVDVPVTPEEYNEEQDLYNE